MKQTIVRRLQTLRHPYLRSPRRHIYEEVAENCGSTPDHVYKIAHGARPSTFDDTAIVSELVRLGILQ